MESLAEFGAHHAGSTARWAVSSNGWTLGATLRRAGIVMTLDSPLGAAKRLARLELGRAGDPLFDPGRLRAVLEDSAAFPKLEINLIWLAAHARIPLEFQTSSLPVASVMRQGIRRLMDDYGLAQEAATWVVEVWMLCHKPNGPSVWRPGNIPAETVLVGTWIGKRITGADEGDVSLTIVSVQQRTFEGRVVEPTSWAAQRAGYMSPVIESNVSGTVGPDGRVSFTQVDSVRQATITFVGSIMHEGASVVLRGRWQMGNESGVMELRKVGTAS